MELKFDAATFETIQNLVFPLVKSIFGIDISNWVGDKAGLFDLVGNALGELQELFFAVGEALRDGILTEAEINNIIAQAKDIPTAVSAIANAISTEDGVE